MLLLADGRLPSGGYAHSGGLEPMVHTAEVNDAASLESFLHGRVMTTGMVAACFAAAACDAALSGRSATIDELDRELDARMPSAVSRAVSRTLGRQLTRTLREVHPHHLLDELPMTAHQPIVYGVAAASLGLTPADGAYVVAHESIAGPAAAAAKVLRIDPFAVHEILFRLAPVIDEVVDTAARAAQTEPSDLPAVATPLLDIAAENHSRWEVRLFAS